MQLDWSPIQYLNSIACLLVRCKYVVIHQNSDEMSESPGLNLPPEPVVGQPFPSNLHPVGFSADQFSQWTKSAPWQTIVKQQI